MAHLKHVAVLAALMCMPRGPQTAAPSFDGLATFERDWQPYLDGRSGYDEALRNLMKCSWAMSENN